VLAFDVAKALLKFASFAGRPAPAASPASRRTASRPPAARARALRAQRELFFERARLPPAVLSVRPCVGRRTSTKVARSGLLRTHAPISRHVGVVLACSNRALAAHPAGLELDVIAAAHPSDPAPAEALDLAIERQLDFGICADNWCRRGRQQGGQALHEAMLHLSVAYLNLGYTSSYKGSDCDRRPAARRAAGAATDAP